MANLGLIVGERTAADPSGVVGRFRGAPPLRAALEAFVRENPCRTRVGWLDE
jgi:hypothetical protein